MLYPIQNSVRNKLDISGIWDFKTDPDVMGEAERLGQRPDRQLGRWPFPAVGTSSTTISSAIWTWPGTSRRSTSRSAGRASASSSASARPIYFGTVYVNGVKVGSHEGGHLPFAFEITDQVKWDEENVIAISVENELKPDRVPSGNMPGSDDEHVRRARRRPRTTSTRSAGIHRPVVLYTRPADLHRGCHRRHRRSTARRHRCKVKVKLNAAVAGTGLRAAQGRRDRVSRPI